MAVQSLQCEETVLEAGLERPWFPHRLGPVSSPQETSSKCGRECVYLLPVTAWEERGRVRVVRVIAAGCGR